MAKVDWSLNMFYLIFRLSSIIGGTIAAASKPPLHSGVTSLTNRKIVASKSTFAVMTSHATLSLSGGVMIERLRLRHLTALRHSRPDLMTLVARHFLVFPVTKADAKGLRKLRRS
jgi:hypothetical protein